MMKIWVFVRIEAGKFQMGSSKTDPDAMDSEFPRHEVDMSEYYISKYPVTVAQFREFIRDSEYNAGKKWENRCGQPSGCGRVVG